MAICCSTVARMSGAALVITSLEGWAINPVLMGKAERMHVVVVFVGGHDRGALMGLDLASGVTRWQWTGGAPAYASPVVATLAGVKQQADGIEVRGITGLRHIAEGPPADYLKHQGWVLVALGNALRGLAWQERFHADTLVRSAELLLGSQEDAVEDGMLRPERAVWLPRGLTRDYEELGTRGHVDMVAAIPSPGTILLHDQRDPEHPDFAVSRQLREVLEGTTDAAGRRWEIIDLPAPEQLRDGEGFVDWSYANHLVVNDGVISCGYGDEVADARARDILSAAYPGRRVVTVDARPILSRGGGIHCITQQQPAAGPTPGAVQGGRL